MPVIVEWFDQKNAIAMMRYQGEWTWEQHYKALSRCKVVMEKSDAARIDTIAVLEGQYFPTGGNISLHALNSIRLPTGNLGLVVVVASSRLISGMLKFALRATRRTRLHYRTATSIEEAQNIIVESRVSQSVQL